MDEKTPEQLAAEAALEAEAQKIKVAQDALAKADAAAVKAAAKAGVVAMRGVGITSASYGGEEFVADSTGIVYVPPAAAGCLEHHGLVRISPA